MDMTVVNENEVTESFHEGCHESMSTDWHMAMIGADMLGRLTLPVPGGVA